MAAFFVAARHYNPEDSHLHISRRENLNYDLSPLFKKME
jgi:hypothetical protein